MRPKHHRIFHLSDVHLGGDYNGIYPVEKNFEDAVRIIADKVSQKNVSEDDSDNQYEDDILLVTGDIVDGDDTAEPEDRAKNAELYRYFWSTLCKYRLNINTRIYVMPGNHDDPVLISTIIPNYVGHKTYSNVKAWHTCSEILNFGWIQMLFLETFRGTVDSDELKSALEYCRQVAPEFVVTHYPIADVKSNFMRPYGLKNRADVDAALYTAGIKYNICGHFHRFAAEGDKVKSLCASSTQCEIDCVEEKFTAIARPSFNVLEFINNTLISVKQILVSEDGAGFGETYDAVCDLFREEIDLSKPH